MNAVTAAAPVAILFGALGLALVVGLLALRGATVRHRRRAMLAAGAACGGAALIAAALSGT